MKKSTENYIKIRLHVLAELIQSFEYITAEVLEQKSIQRTDYLRIGNDLDRIFKEAEDFRRDWSSHDINIEHFDLLISTLRESISALGDVFNEQRAKIEETGGYSWLKYKKDLKRFQRSYEDFQNARQLFGNDISSNDSSEDEIIEAPAKILDPKHVKPIEENMQFFKSDYDEMMKHDGYVYIARSYDNGERQDLSIPKDMWEGMRDALWK